MNPPEEADADESSAKGFDDPATWRNLTSAVAARYSCCAEIHCASKVLRLDWSIALWSGTRSGSSSTASAPLRMLRTRKYSMEANRVFTNSEMQLERKDC